MNGNEFGYTRWGMDWVRLAEPLRQTAPNPLLPRARSIARNNGVRATVQDRVVRATIHRGNQASVTYLEVAPLPRADIAALTAIISGATVPTDDMHRAATAAGIGLAPVPAASDCSCNARSPRCLHMLAVCYEMARRVDQDPRLALGILGFSATEPGETIASEPSARWTPIGALDPAEYFGTTSTTRLSALPSGDRNA